MAILKLYNGSRQQLDLTTKEAGSLYILNDGSFWFDYLDASGTVQRRLLNGEGGSTIVADKAVKYVDFLPTQGEQGFVYIVPKLLYTDTQYIDATVADPSSGEGSFQIPTTAEVPAGEYKVYVKETITYNNANIYDLCLAYYDNNNSYTNTTDLFNNSNTVRYFSSFDSCTYTFAGKMVNSDSGEAIFEEGTVKGDIAFIIEEPGERKYLSYVWIDDQWELLGEGADATNLSKLFSEGEGTKSILAGNGTKAAGDYGFAQGEWTFADGLSSHAEGYGAKATGNYSHAEGQGTTASQTYAHAEGYSTQSTGWASHSEGRETLASGNQSHAEGYKTVSSGGQSHAEGHSTQAIGNLSHAEGHMGAAIGASTHIEGGSYYAPLDGYNNFAAGAGLSTITDLKTPSIPQWEKSWKSVDADTGKTPEWRYALAYGQYSHVEGENGLAFGPYSHVEGHMNIAKGIAAHAEGIYNEAVGKQSHAEGGRTITIGRVSHSEGLRTIAHGAHSHAEGILTDAGGVINGIIDSADNSTIAYYQGGKATMSEIGDIVITLSGYKMENYYVPVGGSILIQPCINTTTKVERYLGQIIKYELNSSGFGVITAYCPQAELIANNPGRDIRVFPIYTGLPSEAYNTVESVTESKLCSTLVLKQVFLGNEASEVLIKVGVHYYSARVLSADWSNESATTIVIDKLFSKMGATVSNARIHIASDKTSIGAHSEGRGTWASALASHAEGIHTKALACGAHSGGLGTVADEDNLTVIGRYNVLKESRGNSNNPALFIVGNGSNGTSTGRSDALRVLQDGTVEINGVIKTPYVTIDANFSAQKNWESEKWILIGDSLTASSPINGVDLVGKRYFELIANKTGIQIDNKAVSGTGYKRQSDENSSNTSGTAANAFWNIAANLTASTTESPVITIFGSGNDLLHFSNLGTVTDTETNTICGCVNKTLDTIYQKLPLARVCIVTPTPWKGSEPDKTSGQMSQYVDKLIEICHLRGIPCLDLYHNSALRPQEDTFRAAAFCEDTGTHPNALGHQLIAPRFKAMLDTLIL